MGSCFTLGWLEQVLVWLVIVGAIFAIIKLLVPLVLSAFGAAGGTLAQIINIVLWAIIVIMIICIAFALIGCLGGGMMPPLPHR